MGASGRPNYNAFERQAANDFFLDSCKKWFEKTKIEE
jgi:abhydrolase domain-containing protein 5